MHFISQTVSDGVSEQLFTLGDIPGVLWTPAGATGPHPLVLVGHGGGQHKTAPGVVARARRYVKECGFAAASIDAPSHGEPPAIRGTPAFHRGKRWTPCIAGSGPDQRQQWLRVARDRGVGIGSDRRLQALEANGDLFGGELLEDRI